MTTASGRIRFLETLDSLSEFSEDNRKVLSEPPADLIYLNIYKKNGCVPFPNRAQPQTELIN